MEITKRKFLIVIAVCLCAAILVGFTLGWQVNSSLKDLTGLSFLGFKVHMSIGFFKNGVLMSSQYHSGEVTYEGMKFMLSKLTGNTTVYDYVNTIMLSNATYLTLGYNATATELNQSSTFLPNEWVRTIAYPIATDTPYMCNWTCVIQPTNVPAQGFNANNIGLCYTSILGEPSLIAYDTFNAITGIDATFTVTCNFSLSLQALSG